MTQYINPIRYGDSRIVGDGLSSTYYSSVPSVITAHPTGELLVLRDPDIITKVFIFITNKTTHIVTQIEFNVIPFSFGNKSLVNPMKIGDIRLLESYVELSKIEILLYKPSKLYVSTHPEILSVSAKGLVKVIQDVVEITKVYVAVTNSFGAVLNNFEFNVLPSFYDTSVVFAIYTG